MSSIVPSSRRLAATGLIAAAAVLAISHFAAGANPPNIVIILTDDQGYQDLGCYGSPNIKTPHIDQLAAEGLRFTDFYSAFPVCSASRAGLMTGCYQPRINMPGVIPPHAETALNPDEVTIAEVLKPLGYATCFIGKWHLGDAPETLPTSQGFDRYYGLPYSNDMARRKGWPTNPVGLDRIWKEKRWDIFDNQLYRDTEVVESPVNQVTLTDRYADETVRYIRENRDHPFYVQLATSMPHVPLFVSEERYVADPHQAYKAAIEHIDSTVGQIMAALEECGVADNTWVIYTSDNGPWLVKAHHGGSALPLRDGKATTYEGGMRVPGIMSWPARIAAGGVSSQVAASIDLLPTIAAMVGAHPTLNGPIDGLDISALLTNPDAPSPHATKGFFYCQRNHVSAVRVGNLKLRRGDQPQLYDLESDVGESNNLAAERPEDVARLEQIAAKYESELLRNARPPWRMKEKSSS
jgi:arylsulfatase A